MGKKLDALLGRGFKPTKFKATVNLAISRQAVLKTQHQSRFSVARSDVIQILNLGHHDRALLRVEQVIKEQNIIDVLVMIESYCYQLIERINLLEDVKECPEELKEAISSMIYAATRCGEFPELRELRDVFTLRFGKEFVARAVELRNSSGVNLKMIQKLSTKMPSMENRVKVLKEIALENNIVFQVDEPDPEDNEDPHMENIINGVKPINPDSSMKRGRKYKDVADAAQAAFESAAYAAEAARAAVELSRGDSYPFDEPRNMAGSPNKKDLNIRNQTGYSSGDDELNNDNKNIKRSLSTSSSDSTDSFLNETKMALDEEKKMQPEVTSVDFNGSDDENSSKNHEITSFGKIQTVKDDVAEDSKIRSNFSSEDGDKSKEHIKKNEDDSNINKAPVSVRTRRTYRR